MSFAYMPLYTGDYLRDTQHLSCSEHGIYLKLLMHCWDQKGPAPLDERKLCGIVNARSGDETEALRRVLPEFFVRMDDGWYNTRMMRELQRAEAISNNRAEAGRLGGIARASKAAKQVLSKCQASAKQEPVSPTPTPNQTNTKETQTHTRFSALGYLCDRGVDKQIASDWLVIRRAKRLPATETALKAIERQAELAQFTLPAVIRVCTEKGWAGFKAEWLHEVQR
jgi:uncharacterized protein YdaU (DUF1376 family)